MIKKLLKKFLFGYRASSESYITYLRKIGVEIGKDCTIYSPRNTIIDEQYPWLITIGSHVRITEGVILLTHDYSWSVLKRINVNQHKGAILGAAGSIKIGDNVFIGMNTIVLRGVTIGNNVVIGAGSVVSRDCEEGWIYAGNPAQKIMRIDYFYKKRKEKQLEEAKLLATSYYKRVGKMPPKEVFHEFFMLFTDEKSIDSVFLEKMNLCNNFEDSRAYMANTNPIFKNFEDFLNYCFEKKEE